MKQLTAERVRRLLRYNKESGKLFWRVSRGSVAAGKEAGTLKKNGYYYIAILGRKYQVHRVIWLIVYGHWPIHTIDHINRNPGDNRLLNLRDVPQGANKANSGAYKNNRLGVKGVSRSGKRFKSSLFVNGKSIYLGTFDTPEQASRVFQDAHRRHWTERMT